MVTTPTPRKLRVLIIRHGETRENVERIIQGQLDTDLNDKGRRQAELTGKFLSTTRIDRIIASPLRRAADTAKAIVEHHKARSDGQELQLECDDRLKERAFGVLEGKVYLGAHKKSEDTEGIERMDPFSERLGSFWNDLVTRAAPESHSKGVHKEPSDASEDGDIETVVLVSHGAAISALINQVLLPGRYCIVPPTVLPSRIWNCSITEIITPVIVTSESTRAIAGDMARKRDWSIRPIHLGVQGSQFLLDHELQKSLLASTKTDGTAAAEQIESLHELEAMVRKTESEFERDPEGKKQLERDIIRAPDGRTVEADIGYGRAIGVVLQWSNVEHLRSLEESSAATHTSPNGNRNNVNVDELVK
ncbi:phosphoglycerate mutase-like protein [Testicularia cyperi]|uniref:Phosphoglycerate mutase-like protein n=1 Tax=Testicularia cyperi TaxID=1882483 RepID=A0A317XMK6_9BASI|nr:phosphoglycerate mutase-like protein [Testicularia cyperi]